MERYGDIQYIPEKLECQRRWLELTDLLNDKSLGEPKSMEKWRKCWSEYKTNTKRKLQRMSRNEVKVKLTKVERRLLKLMEDNYTSHNTLSAVHTNNDNTIIVKTEIVEDEEPCEKPLSSSNCYFHEAKMRTRTQRNPSKSSSGTIISKEQAPTPGKRKKDLEDIKDLAEKYLEFEGEREKLAHEREMARIKQNDQFVAIFGRIADVMETLAPSIQKFLDRNTDDGR